MREEQRKRVETRLESSVVSTGFNGRDETVVHVINKREENEAKKQG